MQVVVTGISHKTASLELRECMALGDEASVDVARTLLNEPGVYEAVALSTCNRTELYMYAADVRSAREAAMHLLAERSAKPRNDVEPSTYSYAGDAAISHLFRVTASLDSMVVGEAQIVAQLKNAYQIACEGGCTNVVFNRLFRHALETGKRVRTETAIGERPVSISSAAVELALQVFGKFKKHSALILGAGEMSELTAVHLKSKGIERILVSNRTFAAAEDLAARVEGTAVPWEDLEKHLVVADVVISSTSAPHFVVTRQHVERAMKARKHRPIFLVDIAVPRDLDPEINRIDDAYLYDIDDLQQVVEENRGERDREAALAEHIVTAELAKSNTWLRSLEVVPTVAGLRETVCGIRDAEHDRLANRLADLSDDQRQQVEMLTTSIVNKILHLPTVKMKEAAGSPDSYVYADTIRTLFGLNGTGAAAAAENSTTPPADAGAAASARDPETDLREGEDS